MDYLFGAGIGTNIGASILWGFVAGFIGYFVAKKLKRAWQSLHARHDEHHSHLARIEARLEDLHNKVDNA